MNEEIKKIIIEAKTICLIPSENEPESLTASLALFYTLKELGKNVNLITENFPERLNFLVPSVDFISSPKNFVISIPRSTADISQIYYEKTDENLKIHLTTDRGNIKKENIFFYFEDAKPDLVITLGVRDFRKYMETKLDSFGFLLGSPILNIDTSAQLSAGNQTNLNFGQINLVEEKSFSEIILNIVKSVDANLIKKNAADCLLCGLIMHYENFKNVSSNETVFQIASDLIKRGADNQQIVDNLYKTTDKEINFLGKLLQNLKRDPGLSTAIIDSKDFENLSEMDTSFMVQKVKTLGIQEDLLVLWESHNSKPAIKGFFYSSKNNLKSKILEKFNGVDKNNWVFLSLPGDDINLAKENILKLVQ